MGEGAFVALLLGGMAVFIGGLIGWGVVRGRRIERAAVLECYLPPSPGHFWGAVLAGLAFVAVAVGLITVVAMQARETDAWWGPALLAIGPIVAVVALLVLATKGMPRIAAGKITLDGEALRVRWRDGSQLVVPLDDELVVRPWSHETWVGFDVVHPRGAIALCFEGVFPSDFELVSDASGRAPRPSELGAGPPLDRHVIREMGRRLLGRAPRA